MSYLSDVKKQLKTTHDEAFGYLWEDVEKALKQSYRNGYDEGLKDAKEGKSEPAAKADNGRRWRGRGASSSDAKEDAS